MVDPIIDKFNNESNSDTHYDLEKINFKKIKKKLDENDIFMTDDNPSNIYM